MATSLRQTMQTAGFGGKNTMSVRKDLVRKIPIYASNPLISLRKQLEFVAGHFAIKGLLGAPAMGLWVDDASVVTDPAKYQTMLKFARENGVNSLYLPLQPFKQALDAAAIKDRLQSACDAPNFMSVELVYADDGAYDGATSADVATNWVTATLEKTCKQAHANPVAVQSDVEPQKAGALPSGDPKINNWLTFMNIVIPAVHGYNIDMTAATADIHTTWAGNLPVGVERVFYASRIDAANFFNWTVPQAWHTAGEAGLHDFPTFTHSAIAAASLPGAGVGPLDEPQDRVYLQYKPEIVGLGSQLPNNEAANAQANYDAASGGGRAYCFASGVFGAGATLAKQSMGVGQNRDGVSVLEGAPAATQGSLGAGAIAGGFVNWAGRTYAAIRVTSTGGQPTGPAYYWDHSVNPLYYGPLLLRSVGWR